MLLLLFSSSAFGQNEGKQHPRSVKEAVSTLLQTLPGEEQDYLREMPKERLIDLHFGLGLYIRNSLIRHGGAGGRHNEELMKSCAKEAKTNEVHIDGCSGIILEALWNKVRSNTNPALVKDLDEQFNLLKKIEIKNRNYREKNLGEIINDINLQVADSLLSVQMENCPPAKLLVANTPSVDLAVRRGNISDFLRRDSMPLLNLLYFLEERYWLRMKRQPPQIILDKAR